ncbi:MAG: EF-P lysine aminoacylase EpmA [Chromatiales bacterium]|jgi:lysyl-tRNA synthetase class 2|nr:EF-P lysine aminoacylase EpmA [Chromatiales bacterium]MDX9766519.1 EF-P lysine aminoacylase EpmA [Ectothiorhodospiraceae bacterium]
MNDWRPGAERALLERRARMLIGIRAFFSERGVLEVETPILSAAGATDPQLASFRLDTPDGPRWLHTSPEFPMKRLLAAGSGDIYQLCRVFRAGEAGVRHNPEFTLLEWYRQGFSVRQLMDELEALVQRLAAERLDGPTEHVSYRDAFLRHAGFDPLDADVTDCRAHATRLQLGFDGELDRDGWLDLILSLAVAPRFPPDRLTFLYDYPASQAALARIRPDDPRVAVRFELFWGELELANGFHELADAAEQRHRFEVDNARRRSEGLSEVAIDERLLAALAHGLPDCSGVALGVDRLFQRISGKTSIGEVMAFDWSRA